MTRPPRERSGQAGGQEGKRRRRRRRRPSSPPPGASPRGPSRPPSPRPSSRGAYALRARKPPEEGGGGSSDRASSSSPPSPSSSTASSSRYSGLPPGAGLPAAAPRAAVGKRNAGAAIGGGGGDLLPPGGSPSRAGRKRARGGGRGPPFQSPISAPRGGSAPAPARCERFPAPAPTPTTAAAEGASTAKSGGGGNGGEGGRPKRRGPRGPPPPPPASSDFWIRPRSEAVAVPAAPPSRRSSARRRRRWSSGAEDGGPPPPSSSPSPPPSSARAGLRPRERLVTMPPLGGGGGGGGEKGGREQQQHSFVLSVAPSTVPNAGRGLFLTYRGPSSEWTVPAYVDLGRYGPHRPGDVKRDFLMEVKNFVFQDRPSEWSFDGFRGNENARAAESSRAVAVAPALLFGREIAKDVIFDITDDETGEVHELAERTLLPFVNEVAAPPRRGKRGGSGAGGHPRQVQNVDAVHHDDGSLHYLLRAGGTFRRDEATELFVHYGAKYEGNRRRKRDAYGGGGSGSGSGSSRADGAAGLSSRQSSSSTLAVADGGGDSSTSSGGGEVGPGDGGEPSADCALAPSSRHNVVTTVCSSCTERRTVLCSKTPVSASCFANMHKSILTYTAGDVMEILDLFLQSPPAPPVARHRMRWVLDQLGPYAKEMLYRRGPLPAPMLDRLEKALALFPRGVDDPNHEQDARIMENFEYLGAFVRKESGRSGFKTGVVEQVLSVGGERKFLVVYFIGEGEEVLSEAEVAESCVGSCFGMFMGG